MLKNNISYFAAFCILLSVVVTEAEPPQISELNLQHTRVVSAPLDNLPLRLLSPGVNCVAALWGDDNMGTINVFNLSGETTFTASVGPYPNNCGMLGSRSHKVWIRSEAPEESWDYELFDIDTKRSISQFWSKDFLWPSQGGEYFYCKFEAVESNEPTLYAQDGKEIGVLPHGSGPWATYSTDDSSIWMLDGNILKQISIVTLRTLREYTLSQFDAPYLAVSLSASPDGTVFAASNDSLTVILDVLTGGQSKVTFPNRTFISLNDNFILSDSGMYFVHIFYLKKMPYFDLYGKVPGGYDLIVSNTAFPDWTTPVRYPPYHWAFYGNILIINYLYGSKYGTCSKSALLEIPINDGQSPFMQAIDGLAIVEYPPSSNKLFSFDPNKGRANSLHIHVYSIVKEKKH